VTRDEAHPLAALFIESANRAPERIALRDIGGAWTYAEVAAAASRLAGRLAAAGLAPGDRVGILASRRAGGPVAILAALWSGATYVPVDPAWPAPRRAEILKAARVSIVVAIDTKERGPDDVVRIDVATPALFADRAEPTSPPRACPSPGIAYIIFTSGSTGVPKGVMLRSSAAASLVTSAASLTGLDRESALFALSSFAFDISVFEIFAPWAVGGELVVAADTQIRANRLSALLEQSHRRPYLQSTPTVLEHLLRSGLKLPARAVLLLAGERLRRSLVTQVAHVEQVWNLYGPTETTIYATAHACLPLAPDDSEPDLPIGTAVNGAVLRIRPFTSAAQDVGELIIGGPGVALGYLDQPELTLERFFDGGSRYATGDLVRRRKDDSLVYIGRFDRQVKIRGHRVELDEVETAVVGLLGHGRAVVQAVEHDALGLHIAAFVVLGPGRDVLELRQELAGLLPPFMVPTRICQVKEIPMTSSGKIDRNALTGPHGKKDRDGAVLEKLSQLWEQCLGAPAELDSNFFALGGHSLTALQIATGLEDAYDIEVDVGLILRHPVLSDLALEISELVQASVARA
jgi:amino acid adenylation domain-containing protein